jgi:uncharacterized protein (TIGR03118 family)
MSSAWISGRFAAIVGLAALLAACGGGSGSSGYSGSGGNGATGAGGAGGYGSPPPMSPPPPTPPTAYSMTKLVSDGAVTAKTTDANLINPWGLVFAPNAPAWIANNGTQTSTVYDGTGQKVPLTVAIPAGTNGAADPTGIVANASSDFVITEGTASGPAQFIFDGEGGTLSAWAFSVDQANAITVYDDGAGGAVYKGLAIAANSSGANRLYATDFHNNKIDVFDGTFHKVTAPGGFTDPTLPAGYAPFGIQALTLQNQTMIVVTYAKQLAPDNHDDQPGAGFGLVDLYDTDGNLKTHLIPTGGKLNAPWGIALAPANFGTYSNDLLIGNFGDGAINAYDPTAGTFVGTIADVNGQAIASPGLWAIAFGNGAKNQPTTTLYFTAGIASEADGLYGRIDLGATPPDTTAPTVSITAPAAGTVSGSVTVTVSASDDVGVTSVKVLAGTTVVATLTAAPYTTSWDTTQVANGTVALTAQAQDAAGNVTVSAPVSVTVSNSAPPPPAAVKLSDLQAQIFTPICSVCHTGGGTSLPSSMDLTAGHTFTSLVGVASVEQPSLKRVAPGDPDNSYVIHKLEGTAGISGGRMPLGGPYLDQATIDMVRTWISQGAQNN